MTTELDALMDQDPLDLSSKDIDIIIQFHRNNRAKEEPGGRMKKPAPKGKVDLTALIQSIAKPKAEGEAPKPPVGGGLRRL